MNISCLKYRLSTEERSIFDEKGYLIQEDVLTKEHIDMLTYASDKIYAAKVAAGHDSHSPLFYPNFIPDDPLFAALVGATTNSPR